MPTFDTFYEDDEGREVECQITFSYYAGTPARPYGDPPDPGDDEELLIEEVLMKPSEFCSWKDAVPIDIGDYGYTEECAKMHEQKCWDYLKSEVDNQYQ